MTGADDEWCEPYDDSGTQQNKRNSTVFRDVDGQAYWIDGRVFWNWYSAPDIYNGEPYKVYFTSRDSRVDIEFPWVQPDKPIYVFEPTKEFPNEELK